MTSKSRPDPDLPAGRGRVTGLHLRFGRILIGAVNTLRPRVTLGVRLAAFDDRDHVLLVRQRYTPGWCLPGGGVGPGETCREAALREAREEAGLEACGTPTLFGVYHNQALGGRDHVVLFVAREARQMTAQPRSLEVGEARFFPPEALPDDATPATLARLGEISQGRQDCDLW